MVLVAHTELGLGTWICCSGCQWGPWGGWDVARAAALLVQGDIGIPPAPQRPSKDGRSCQPWHGQWTPSAGKRAEQNSQLN